MSFHSSSSLPSLNLSGSPEAFSYFPHSQAIFSVAVGRRLTNNCWRIRAISKPNTRDEWRKKNNISKQESTNSTPVVVNHTRLQEDAKVKERARVVRKLVSEVKLMHTEMEDGKISPSPYDTAWVAMVMGLDGGPLFPSCLEWIARNQLPDGSWGDRRIFHAHDRLINTLGCVVALKSWNFHSDKCEKGITFFKANLSKLKDQNADDMPIGFEVAFPSLLELAKSLGVDVGGDSPELAGIYAGRETKLRKIPAEVLHNVHSTLLHSIEGMPGLDWEKLVKLQSKDGSFLFSPSSTAYAFMKTNNTNCFTYLNQIVKKFNGGVPNVYPVDLFERMWTTDRLQRLGISRFFQKEIDDCLSYVYRFWSVKGICWARNSAVSDVDDTAMGFRLLRLHGYNVSPDVFVDFQNDDEFVCFKGQSTQAVTGMLNLYRASQVKFPRELILDRARTFASNFLVEKQRADKVVDKWVISKDLPGEVRYWLQVPWYASLPRLEARFYIEQYGGDDDVWIGKTLYRMPYVSNNMLLNLAIEDYNYCQALHRKEWDAMQIWYEAYGLNEYGVTRESLLTAYYVAAASIFEPERYLQRLAWAKTTVCISAARSFFLRGGDRDKFFNELRQTRSGGMVKALKETIDQLSLELMGRNDGVNVASTLHDPWGRWVMTWTEEGGGEAELAVETLIATAGQRGILLSHLHPEYKSLCRLVRKLYSELGQYKILKVREVKRQEIEGLMEEVVQLAFERREGCLDPMIKQFFFVVARSIYYLAYCDHQTVKYNIYRVLFEVA